MDQAGNFAWPDRLMRSVYVQPLAHSIEALPAADAAAISVQLEENNIGDGVGTQAVI